MAVVVVAEVLVLGSFEVDVVVIVFYRCICTKITPLKGTYTMPCHLVYKFFWADAM